ncbi:MAG TPA: IniB N-terminal domain-containing protein [Kutzneria sp.]|jgi:hypothetical protein
MAQTLHEFTLGLLSDAPTRELFAADPTGVLQSAGLGDITAADVHEILPLVLDMAPTHVVEAFEQTLGGAVPGLPGADAIATLQHLTTVVPVAVPALPVDGLGRELPLAGLSAPGLDALPGLDSLPVDGLSLPALDGLPVGSLPGLDGLGRELPVNGALDSLPLGSLPTLPLDGVTGLVPSVPGVDGLVPNVTDPTALVGDLRGTTNDPARALTQLQQNITQVVPVVAGHGGIPAVPSVDALVGKVTNVASDVDVTKTLDTTTHTVAGVAGNVPVAGKVIADASGHVTSAVHGVDVDGLSKTVTGVTSHIGGIGNVTTDPIHAVTGIANDPIHAVTNIADVSHTLDTVSSLHGDQALQHVSGAVDGTVKDLNIGDDNHIGGIGNVDLGGVHVGDITHNLDATHLTGF